MKPLKEQLSGNPKQIRELRVQNFVNMLCEQSRNLIEVGQNGKCEYRKLQMHLESIVDIAPHSSIDLASELAKTDVNKLMNDINEITQKMYDIARIIARRVAVHNRLFPDSPIDGLTKEELDFICDIKLAPYDFTFYDNDERSQSNKSNKD